jgi:hypothetical protein
MAHTQGKALRKGNEMLAVLQKYLSDWHLARQKFVVLFVQSVLKIGVKSLLEIAGAFDSSAQRTSSLRRIERFLNGFEFSISLFGNFMLAMLHLRHQGLVLLLDRTEWQFGKTWVNILMLSVSVEGMSVPLFWRVYNKKGLSSQQERIDFMRSFFRYFPDLCITCLIGDREFIGKHWFSYLEQEARIPCLIRLRENLQVHYQGKQKPIKVYCRNVKMGQYSYKGCFQLCETNLHVWATHLRGEWLILGTTSKDLDAFAIYKQRWGIETLFKALKTQGFHIEHTALCQAPKIEKLLFLLAFAFVWAYKTGLWLNERKPIRICPNGRREFSFFRYGFLFLQYCLLNDTQYPQLVKTIQLLSED